MPSAASRVGIVAPRIFFGYSRDEVIGQLADLIFTGEDRAQDVPGREMQQALEAGRASDNRWHRRKDGTRFWANGAMLPMHSQPDGRVIGFVKILRDETIRREAEQAVEAALREAERARTEAEAAGKAKDHFLAVLSHELRTPLTPVLMAVDVLSRSEKLDQPAREALEMIRHNVELEADFIKDLLDVTRIGRGKFAITSAPVDFHEAIRLAIGVSKPEIDDKEQRLTVALDATNHCVEGDFGRLQQVVWNLLKNASKFTPESGEIRVHTRNTDRRVVLEVTDTGIGISRESLIRIFEPFTQENPGIASEFGGLGLGLTIARAVIDAHGGELHAHSAGRDQGSTFSVILPLYTKS
jgi:two-component system CheB/CheR fusion protein